MRAANALVAEVLAELRGMIVPGVTTADLDAYAETRLRDRGGEPAFKGYHGYPATICASVNEEVVHGIPSRRELQEGDIVSVDRSGSSRRGLSSRCSLRATWAMPRQWRPGTHMWTATPSPSAPCG
jgi:methionine aminopeptidase